MSERVIELTPVQREAQRAILEEPEVQEMARRLARWGLGIAMPHMHTAREDFCDLPVEMVQVERAGVVSFVPRQQAEGMIPVGWRWREGGLDVMARCEPFQYCDPNVPGHAFVQGHTHISS